MTTTYQVLVNGTERLRFRADFTQAHSPICTIDQHGRPFATAFQVADARHKPQSAAELLNNWFRSHHLSDIWGDGETPVVAEI
jgi:hypothetical protein